MDPDQMKAMAKAMAIVMRELIAAELRPVLQRLDQLERDAVRGGSAPIILSVSPDGVVTQTQPSQVSRSKIIKTRRDADGNLTAEVVERDD